MQSIAIQIQILENILNTWNSHDFRVRKALKKGKKIYWLLIKLRGVGYIKGVPGAYSAIWSIFINIFCNGRIQGGRKNVYTKNGGGGHACVSFHEEINIVREGFNNQILFEAGQNLIIFCIMCKLLLHSGFFSVSL